MAAYSVFEPPPRGDQTAADPVRFRFLRDGFSWGAFLLGPLWMIWRQLWLVLLGYVVVVAVLTYGFAKLTASADMVMFVSALVALLLGFEGSTLARWTLRRRGWNELDVVVGRTREEAEHRFFTAWVAGNAARPDAPPAAPGASAPPGRSYPPDVVGLFPEPGGTR